MATNFLSKLSLNGPRMQSLPSGRLSRDDHRMKYRAAALTLFLAFVCALPDGYAQNQSRSQPTDTTIQIRADISGCGASDSIFFRVTADHMGTPLFWSLTVKDCGGTLLFYASACACEADEYFESEDYLLRRTYRGSKMDWFFNDLPERLIFKRKFSPGSRIFDRNDAGSMYRVARDFLVERLQFSPEKAKKLTEALALKMMNAEVTLLSVVKTPSDPGDPMIYLKEIRQFVPIGPR